MKRRANLGCATFDWFSGRRIEPQAAQCDCEVGMYENS